VQNDADCVARVAGIRVPEFGLGDIVSINFQYDGVVLLMIVTERAFDSRALVRDAIVVGEAHFDKPAHDSQSETHNVQECGDAVVELAMRLTFESADFM
jgi:hypothetical protein